jgi:hypothetical protein
MNQYITFHKVLDLIEDFQQQSPILNSFGYGNLVDFSRTISGDTQNSPVKYPYLFVVPLTIQYDENTTEYQLSLIFADILTADMMNEKDAVSDMSLECRRFLSYVKRGINTFPELYDNMDLQLPVQAIPFMERMADHIAGVAIDVNLTVFEDINACDYYPTPTPTEPPIFVAAGRGTNNLAYSYDGIIWSASTNGNGLMSDSVTTVEYNGSMWVAGGTINNNRLGYSTDGITWSASTNGNTIFGGSVLALCWNGSIWVVGGRGGNTLGYSTDGITWSASTNSNTIFNSGVFSICWNGSIFVAGGFSTNALGYSTDGITWSASTNGNDVFDITHDVAWNGTMFVAAGRGENSLGYSYDGLIWSASTNGNTIFVPAEYGLGLSWNGSMWVASGGINNNRLAYSTDGITWSASTNGNTIFTEFGRSVRWNGSIFVAAGSETNTLGYSYDGITWSASTNGNSVISLDAYDVASKPSPNLYPPR